MNIRLLRILALCSVASLLLTGSALACSADSADPASAEQPAAPAMPAAAVEFTTLKVDGVTCGSCLVPIRRELRALKGIRGIEQGIDIKEVIVSYAPGSVSAQQLVAAIKKAGYDAEVKKAAPPAKS